MRGDRGGRAVGVGGGLQGGAGQDLRPGGRRDGHRRGGPVKRAEAELRIDIGMPVGGERLGAAVAGRSETVRQEDRVVEDPESAFVFLAKGFEE